MYNTSKAALAMASETWRHELEPLGVRIITLVTCATKTHAIDNSEMLEIPETSKYFGIRDLIRDTLASGKLQDGAISSREYAVQVVGKVENGTVGINWVGTNAFLARFSWWLSPRALKVSLCVIERLGLSS